MDEMQWRRAINAFQRNMTQIAERCAHDESKRRAFKRALREMLRERYPHHYFVETYTVPAHIRRRPKRARRSH